LKDTNQALSQFDSIVLQPTSSYKLFTVDVCSLYTSIPHEDGLKAIKFYLQQEPHPTIDTNTLLRLTELVLRLNSFEFNGEFFNQISGVAMGTKMGPSYACLFMGHFEHIVKTTYDHVLPEYYRRYIDDGIGITDMSDVDLTRYFTFISNLHPSINFESHVSDVSVNFLDIQLSLHSEGLSTSVFYKPTDSHSYLLYSSSHPRSCIDAIPYSQLLRLRRLCSDDDDFRDKAHELLNFFRLRDYPDSVLFRALDRVNLISRTEALLPKSRPSSDRPKIILTYHPHNLAATKVFFKHLPILESNPNTSSVFPDKPLVVYKRDRSLRDLLVRSRLTVDSNCVHGTVPCNRKRCLTCKYAVQSNTVIFPGGKFQIRGQFTCESRNVIYAIICKKCGKTYIGETGRKLADRFREHLMDVKNNTKKPIPDHFNLADHHGVDDMSVTAILACTSNDLRRKSMEYRLIYQFGTLQPAGLNNMHSFN
jgi:hypothetical protein